MSNEFEEEQCNNCPELDRYFDDDNDIEGDYSIWFDLIVAVGCCLLFVLLATCGVAALVFAVWFAL